MLEKEYKLLLNINLPHQGLTVNDVIRTVKNATSEIPKKLIPQVLSDIQDTILNKYLGARWNELILNPMPWLCPHCVEQYAFVRRGFRPRKLITSCGVIEFKLYQVTCKSCRKTFSPFPQLLGLPTKSRIAKEFEEKIVSLVLRNSYKATSNYIEEMLDVSISPTSIHTAVKNCATNTVIFNETSEVNEILMDSTKVKAGEKERGIDVHVALAPIEVIKENGRNSNKKVLVAFDVALSGKYFEQQLKKFNCSHFVTDGDLGYVEMGKRAFPNAHHQRCLWHLPYNLNHCLYMEGMPQKHRLPFIQKLREILFLSKSKEIAEKDYTRLVIDLIKHHKVMSANYLTEAYEGVFTVYNPYKNHSCQRTTSLVEQEMREINRRTDVGSRWTVKGVKSIIKLHLIKKYSRISWDLYFKSNRRKLGFPTVKLCS